MTDLLTQAREAVEGGPFRSHAEALELLSALADALEAAQQENGRLREALKSQYALGYSAALTAAAALAKAHATCGCGGAHGRCNTDDAPLAIAEEIAALQSQGARS